MLDEVVVLLSQSEEPPGLLPARQQMAFSLGWHILLACFGVAFPAIIFVVHRRGIVGSDAVALTLAKRWAKVSAVLFAIGAVSGTVLSFEMGLLWPGLMGPFGDVLGLPFAFEGLSFFVEAIFLGIYLYGWNRMPPRRHLAMLVPMAIAGVVGTFCVVSVNAWMNHPAGFTIRDGKVTDVDPWAAMFNQNSFLQFLHMWVAAFMVVGLTVAGAYAAGILRGHADAHHRLGFTVPFTFATVAAVAQPFVGHLLGMRIHDTQPAKLAAFELAETTESPAPLRLGGVLIDGEVRWALSIPRLGSLIARNSWDAPVPGLDTVPRDEWPPVNITHLAFQSMVLIGTLLALFTVVYWLARRRGRDLLHSRWFLRMSVVSGPLAMAAVECGWVATEVGRQPWTVWQVLRTADAASTSGGLWWSFIGILVVYLGMTIGAYVVLRSMARRWRAGQEELPSPYGPPVRSPSPDRDESARP
ncbi:cytochrome ubiquinol oxidase subunit I [Mycolicibacterium frederiksbergense]|nr:cytochrome ubiquinol oxidase subunit I [Mycolicibacterium frederiksbergense]